jgi:hypothetical protein
MPAAFVLGNGRSRLAVNLHELKLRGPIYGCNALYREFVPDTLISTDRPISERIQQEGYALKNRMYTRKPMAQWGALPVPQEYYGFSSGPIAMAQAALDGHCVLYLLGFDLGPDALGKFNNVYVDTEFYKKSSASPTFTGNWVRQICQIMKTFQRVSFVRVAGDTTAPVAEFQTHHNHCVMPITEFLDRINNLKDL